VYKVDIYGTKEVIESLRLIERATEIGLEDVLDSTATKVRDIMKSRAPTSKWNGGRLQSSIGVKKTGKNSRDVGVISGGYGTRSSPGPQTYGMYVEGGSQAHFPNYDDISSRGFSKTAAFLISKAISRRSQLATNFVKDGSEQAESIFFRLIDQLMNRIIR
jgi:hypothetical protein